MINITRLSAQDDLNKVVFDIQKANWVQASEISSEDYTVENLSLYLKNTESVFVVAYSNENFAGMASANLLNKPNGDTWLYVDEVDVCEDRQRQGIGTALISYLLKFAMDSDIPEVFQVHLGTRDYGSNKTGRVLPFVKFCEEMGLV